MSLFGTVMRFGFQQVNGFAYANFGGDSVSIRFCTFWDLFIDMWKVG